MSFVVFDAAGVLVVHVEFEVTWSLRFVQRFSLEWHAWVGRWCSVSLLSLQFIQLCVVPFALRYSVDASSGEDCCLVCYDSNCRLDLVYGVHEAQAQLPCLERGGACAGQARSLAAAFVSNKAVICHEPHFMRGCHWDGRIYRWPMGGKAIQAIQEAWLRTDVPGLVVHVHCSPILRGAAKRPHVWLSYRM